MRLSNLAVSFVLCSVTSFALAACAVPTESGASSEALDTSAAAIQTTAPARELPVDGHPIIVFGPSTCPSSVSMPNGDSRTMGFNDAYQMESKASISSTSTYGLTECNDKFVMDFGGIPAVIDTMNAKEKAFISDPATIAVYGNMPFQPAGITSFVVMSNASTVKSICENAEVTATVQIEGAEGTFQDVGTRTAKGSYFAGKVGSDFPPSCDLRVDLASLFKSVPGGANGDLTGVKRVRVLASASEPICFHGVCSNAKLPVSGYLYLTS